MVTYTPEQHQTKRRKRSGPNLTQHSFVPQIRLPKCECPGRPFLNRCPTCGRQTALVVSEVEDEESDSGAESDVSELADVLSYPATQRGAEQQSSLQTGIGEETLPVPDAFPFERLPQELKDVVYEHCTIEHFSLPTKPIPPTCLVAFRSAKVPIHYHLRHAPFPGLLGVNRKIGHDYQKVVRQHTTIVFNDHNHFRWQPLDLSQARARHLRHVQHAEFNFDGMCRASPSGCRIASDLAYSLTWIKRTINHFPGLRTVTIRLGLWWSDNLAHDSSWPNSPHDSALLDVLRQFAEVQLLKKMEVYRKPGKDIDLHLTDSEIQAAMWVVWEQGKGFRPPPLLSGVYCGGSEYTFQCRGGFCGVPH
ncbi:hypothetical protein AC578_10861 [Pseudocercospora eumusae]|uniref:Uncharacterized protein n=1 Tax=Pseudocercospora eumusae TaxID=321146 RepID=A0A139H913_9PEZI|nr:hypothetical protein AC578_10861 [Pseudocercospora eumusae]